MKQNRKLTLNHSKPTQVTPTAQTGLAPEDQPLTVRLNIDFDREVYDKLKRLAEREQLSLASFTRTMVARAIRHFDGHEVLHVDGTRCPFDVMAQRQGRA
jgi:hypothetical protein